MFVDVVMYTEKKIKDFSSFCFFWHTFPSASFSPCHISSDSWLTREKTRRQKWPEENYMIMFCVYMCVYGVEGCV